ncbi:MAG: class I SAM-dependent RNA methyltransferase [Oligoflexales bacterium]|nr:class I SAM-dependent RNA methyltransferase [Oligoflexales bacterium]
MTQKYIAICPEEIKEMVSKELKDLGAIQIEAGFKSVRFSATTEKIYEILLKIRTASRILRILREGSATKEIILKSQSSRINWPKLISSSHGFIVRGVAGDRGPDAFSSNEISKIVKEGIFLSFRQKNLSPPKIDLMDPKISVVAFIHDQKVTISLDISGKSHHKRGYREDGHPAPIKETLASALLMLVGYDGSQNFLDPMCGSGTIGIESAYIALNKAPLIHRKKGDFGVEWLLDFDRHLWKNVQDKVRSERLTEPKNKIFLSDISENYTSMARNNALKARVEKHICFSTRSFIDMQPPASTGILIANLPYGERLKSEESEEFKKFYQQIGNTLKRNFTGWTAALLTSEDAPYKFIGLKPRRKLPILNGSIKCKLLIFDLYEGRKGQKTPSIS